MESEADLDVDYPFVHYLESAHVRSLMDNEDNKNTSNDSHIDVRLRPPKEWRVPTDDSPLAFEADYVFGPLGLFVHYQARKLGISKYDKTLHELLRTVINFYMSTCSKNSVLVGLSVETAQCEGFEDAVLCVSECQKPKAVVGVCHRHSQS